MMRPVGTRRRDWTLAALALAGAVALWFASDAPWGRVVALALGTVAVGLTLPRLGSS